MSNADDFIIEKKLSKYTGKGGDVVIPDGIREIGDWAFAGCAHVTSVAIPDGVTEIGRGAFPDGCKVKKR